VYQLLSKPVERSSVVIGKFLGCLAVIATLFTACAILAYLLTAVFSGTVPAPGDVVPVVEAIVAENLMLAVYIAIGILVSTVTKNPFISIIASFLAWVVLFLASTLGNIIGLFSARENILLYAGDTFSLYPLYAKAMIWVDPMSHGMVSRILSGNATGRRGHASMGERRIPAGVRRTAADSGGRAVQKPGHHLNKMESV
jgi:ABC-2 type transport system permease protein